MLKRTEKEMKINQKKRKGKRMFLQSQMINLLKNLFYDYKRTPLRNAVKIALKSNCS